MFDEIAALLVKGLPTELDRTQQEGVIDAVLLLAYADGRLRKEERDLVEQVLRACRWSDDLALARYVAQRRVETMRAIDGGAVDPLLDAIVAKLREPRLLAQLYLVCDRAANADRDVDMGEQDLLAAMLARFRAAGAGPTAR